MNTPGTRSALSDALKQTLITAAVDKITHGKATSDPEGHTQAIADADADAQAPGPDHWTREDIDTAIACFDAGATALERIAQCMVEIMAAAKPPASGRMR